MPKSPEFDDNIQPIPETLVQPATPTEVERPIVLPGQWNGSPKIDFGIFAVRRAFDEQNKR